MARHKLPIEIKRKELFGRVDPRTAEFLQSLGAPNMGRAIDKAVLMLIENGNHTRPELQEAPDSPVAA